MGASDNDSLLGSSPGGGGLIPPAPIYIYFLHRHNYYKTLMTCYCMVISKNKCKRMGFDGISWDYYVGIGGIVGTVIGGVSGYCSTLMFGAVTNDINEFYAISAGVAASLFGGLAGIFMGDSDSRNGPL